MKLDSDKLRGAMLEECYNIETLSKTSQSYGSKNIASLCYGKTGEKGGETSQSYVEKRREENSRCSLVTRHCLPAKNSYFYEKSRPRGDLRAALAFQKRSKIFVSRGKYKILSRKNPENRRIVNL